MSGSCRTVVVTGASSGIGHAIVKEMAQEGAQLVLVGRDKRRLHDVADAVSAHAIAVEIVADDLLDAGAPARIIAAATAGGRRVDVLVHSAGVFEPAPIAETTPESLDRQWMVNVRAPYMLTRAALPHMDPGSSVIFLSSLAGHVGFHDSSAYCATKGAVDMVVRSLAIELAPRGVRINAVAPGIVRTPMNEAQFEAPGYERTIIDRTPARRVGRPSDIAPAVRFLASAAAEFIHGEIVRVDGGWTVQ